MCSTLRATLLATVAGSIVLAPCVSAQKVDFTADFLTTTVDKSMSPGSAYPVKSTLKNLGARAWTKADTALVARWSTGPGAPTGLPDPAFTVQVPREIPSLLTVMIAGEVTAPPVPGDWVLTLRMEQEGKPFGDTETIKITILPEFNAEIARVGIPASMEARRRYNTTVRVHNTGKSDWLPKRMELVLQVLRASANKTLLFGKDKTAVAIPTLVKAGESLDVKVEITPAASGTYTLSLYVWDTEEPDEVGKTMGYTVTVR